MSETYYFYMDDSGVRDPNRRGLERSDGRDWFALGGILIREQDREILQRLHSEFCERWRINYPLHSVNIRGKRNNFNWLGNNADIQAAFLGDLENMLCNLPVIGFASIINRTEYFRRFDKMYKDQIWLLCKSAYTILIERVLKYIIKKDGRLRIRFEMTGKIEDQNIIQYSKELKNSGNFFDAERSLPYNSLDMHHYQSRILGDPEGRTKSLPELQIADLFLHPMVMSAYDRENRAYQALLKCGRLIDSILLESELREMGIKRYCF